MTTPRPDRPENDPVTDARLHELDALLDEINAGRQPSTIDDDLAGFASVIRDVRGLRPVSRRVLREAPLTGQEDFPRRLAANLERELRYKGTRQSASRHSIGPLPERRDSRGTSVVIAHPALNDVEATGKQRGGVPRQFLSLAAAIAAFVIVGVVLSLVLRGTEPAPSASDSDVASGGSAAVPSPGATPERSIVSVTTYTEAQPHVPFPLVEPPELPSGLDLDVIKVERFTDTSTGKESVQANATYTRDGEFGLAYLQSNGGCGRTLLEGEAVERLDPEAVDLLGVEVVMRTGILPTSMGFIPESTGQQQATIYEWRFEGICRQIVQLGDRRLATNHVLALTSAIKGTEGALTVTSVSTYEEAQSLVSYPLIEPTHIPAGLNLLEVVVGDRIGIDESEQTLPTEARYAFGSGQAILLYVQGYPDCDGVSDQAVIQELGGKRVFGGPTDSGLEAIYRWESGGQCSIVHAQIQGSVTQELVEEFIAAVPLPEDSPRVPEGDEQVLLPTPDTNGYYTVGSFAEAQQLVPYRLVAPDAVPAGLIGPEIEIGGWIETADQGRVVQTYARYFSESGEVVLEYIQGYPDCDNVGDHSRTTDLGGKTVFGGPTDLGTEAIFSWEADNQCFIVHAFMRDGMTEDIAAEFIAGVPRP